LNLVLRQACGKLDMERCVIPWGRARRKRQSEIFRQQLVWRRIVQWPLSETAGGCSGSRAAGHPPAAAGQARYYACSRTGNRGQPHGL